jgi:hypothetical protein
MDKIICASCYTGLTADLSNCPTCNTAIFLDGDNKNIIDRIQPNCLVYRYAGSDILEPAVIIKQNRANVRVATKLQEYTTPIVVAKQNVYAFNQNILSAIQALRNERTATMMRYDQLIQSHWQHLEPYQ